MRELKFRAWGYNEYHYIQSLYWFEENGVSGFSEPYNGGYLFEQYTGLKDKNGKEIYEGDITDDGYIVMFGNYDNGESYEDEELGYGYYLFNKNEEEGYGNGIRSIPLYLCININMVIVGNIHENPELLK